MPRSRESDDRPRRRRPPRQDRTVLWVVLGLLAAAGALLMAGGVAVVLWFTLGAKKARTLPAPAGAPAQVEAPAGWQEFRSAEGRFRVLLPGRPAVRKQNVPSPAGPVPDTVCELNTDALSVGVRFADFDGPAQKDFPLDRVIDSGRNDLVKALGGRVVRERNWIAAGARARELVIDSARQGTCQFRWYVRGRRLYVVAVLSLHRDRPPPEEVVHRVFDSFQLTD